MIAPIVPFISDEIYTKLTGEKSVHLSTFPKVNKKLIDEHIEKRMDLVRSLISIGRYVREEAKIKVRQPLSEAILDGKNKELISDLVTLIEEELNIKNIIFVDDLNEYMNLSVKPNFKTVGKVFGPLIKEFQSKLENLSNEEINALNNDQTITMKLGNEEKEITKEMVDIRISSKEGYNVGMENNNFIILETKLTDDLILEGIAREMVSKVQQERKNKDYNVTDRIKLSYNGDEMIDQCISKFKDYIASETLSVVITKQDNLKQEYDLNGHNCYLEIER
jgi:isoleucyl-tRNA synthetase